MTYNEELHIARCIASVSSIASKVLVVDSYSTDRTVAIARDSGADVVQRRWKNYSDQFQWAIDYVAGTSIWVMRLDADEYLEPALEAELPGLLQDTAPLDGVYLKRKVVFQGRWIRYGGVYPQMALRIWRNGIGRIEQRWMDEHIVLPPGAHLATARADFVDESMKGVTFWTAKCNGYATREAVDLLNLKYKFLASDQAFANAAPSQAKTRRALKEALYSRLPLGLRAACYFFYRYIICLGFLDGAAGFQWNFLQAFWYRFLVDLKITEIERYSKGDVARIKECLARDHGLTLD